MPNLRGVIEHHHSLGMAGGALTDLLIVGLLFIALRTAQLTDAGSKLNYTDPPLTPTHTCV